MQSYWIRPLYLLIFYTSCSKFKICQANVEISFSCNLKVCGKGNYSLHTGIWTLDRECRICPVGNYSVTDTATSCIPCPNGGTTDQEGSISASQCRPGKIIHVYTFPTLLNV